MSSAKKADVSKLDNPLKTKTNPHMPEQNKTRRCTMNNNEFKFKKFTYLGEKIKETIVSRTELEDQDYERVDFIYAPCIGVEKFKDRHRNWQEFRKRKRALEIPALEILKATQFNPGIKMDRKMLITKTGMKNPIMNGPLPRYIFILRLALIESKEEEYFIHTQKSPLTVEWDKDRTWIRIEPFFTE